MYRTRGSRGVPSFALMLLLNELVRTATNSGIPPITCATIAAQILLFLRVIPLPWNSVWDVCLSVDSIINKKKYLRLIISQLEHGDDWHLYYNMVSFLWKGRTLEREMGTIRFLITLIIFTISTSFTYIILNLLLANITHNNSYLHTCAVGFSGVIFALKVLTTHYSHSDVNYIMGIPIGSKYAVWAELAVIQLISPNASFVGHLAGILVGLAYVNGPLKYLIGKLSSLLANTGDNFRNHNSSNRSQNTGYARNYQNYFPSSMSEEEQIRRATEESLFSSSNSNSNRSYPTATAPPYPTEPNYNFHSYADNSNVDAETLRRLRLRRYQT